MANKTDMQKIREDAVDWALRLNEGKLGSDARRAFEAWRTARPEHDTAYQRAAAVLGDSQTVLRQDADFTRRNFRPGSHSARSKTIIASLLVGGLCLWYGGDIMLRFEADVMTAAAETATITLPDGTRVYLNGNSALDEDFTQNRRSVRLLRGEAYFEVAKDPARPFLVEAGAGQAEALGTAFNVNLAGSEAEVTVAESRVAVSGDAGGETMVLQPGDRVAYDADGRLGQRSRVLPGFEASWRGGRLVFEERPLATVIEEIFRKLPGRVVIANPATGRRLVSGSFDLNDPEQALKSFAATMGISVVRAGSLVTVVY